MSEPTVEESMDAAARKRFFLLSGVFILIAALVTGGIIYWTSRPADENIKTSVPLTAQDRAEAEKVAKSFITDAGTWGLRTDKVNAENIKDVAFSVQQNTQTANTYWYSRNENYERTKLAYIAPNGPLWFGTSIVQTWWDPISREVMASFRTLEVKPQIPDAGSTLTVNDFDTTAITVPVTYSIKQQKMMATATDSEWDGTYSVQERVYEENAQLVLVKMSEGWRVYKLTGNKYPFLLTSWSTPETDYNGDQHGFTEVNKVKAK